MASSPQAPQPVIVDGKALYTFASTWIKGDETNTTYGCVRADSLAEAAAQGLAIGKEYNPKATYISHGATPVAF